MYNNNTEFSLREPYPILSFCCLHFDKRVTVKNVSTAVTTAYNLLKLSIIIFNKRDFTLCQMSKCL